MNDGVNKPNNMHRGKHHGRQRGRHHGEGRHGDGAGKWQRGKHAKWVWVLFGISSMHIGIALSWGLAYLLMGWIYSAWFPSFGHSALRQYLTLVLALTLLFVFLNLIRLAFNPRGKNNYLMLMINAMQRLSKGDFDVNLNANSRFMGHFEPLVNSFNEMASELSQMEQMRQEFISNVSHEFQSPLTSIGGFARALRNDELPPETRKHYLDIIEMESARLSKLSDNLLKLTSLETKHHPFEPKSYRLDRQLRRIVLSCEPLWLAKRIEMEVDLPPFTVTADEELLDQVWINLLHNAIKFTPEGGTVSLMLTEQINSFCVQVADTGIGIPAEHIPHLFERFYKVDKARNRTGSGSGLGLSIVRKIVDMHKGTAAASSLATGGAEFTVTIPKQPSTHS